MHPPEKEKLAISSLPRRDSNLQPLEGPWLNLCVSDRSATTKQSNSISIEDSFSTKTLFFVSKKLVRPRLLDSGERRTLAADISLETQLSEADFCVEESHDRFEYISSLKKYLMV